MVLSHRDKTMEKSVLKMLPIECFWPVPEYNFRKNQQERICINCVGPRNLEIVILLCAFTYFVQNSNLLCNHGWQCTMVKS